MNAYADKNIRDTLKAAFKENKVAPKVPLIVVEWIRDVPPANRIDFDALCQLLRADDPNANWREGTIAIIFDNLEDMIHVTQQELPKQLKFLGYRVVTFNNPRRNDRVKTAICNLPNLHAHFFLCFIGRSHNRVH